MPSRNTKLKLISPEAWQPVGVESLEDAAESAVRSNCNNIVVAGPGSGKTELLAQRADFLLRTGACPAPKRILAISFKRDSAKNLHDRVSERLPEQVAARLDSWTYAKFDKQLVDRFRLAIPLIWQPMSNYRLDFYEIDEEHAGKMIEKAAGGASVSTGEQMGIARLSWFRDSFCQRLPIDMPEFSECSVEDRLAFAAWRHYLQRNPSVISFQMISRLAELLLRVNPNITAALRSTYSHVFLDEFQDTTNLQYDVVKTAFHNSDSVLTAVGDTKQCIMTWAGALSGVTKTFATEYGATSHILRSNFRSEPELIRITGSLAEQIEPDAVPPVHGLGRTEGVGECRGFEFANDAAEATALAEVLVRTVVEEGVSPRDICVLCRRLVKHYSPLLVKAMRAKADVVSVRDESNLQELLSEPLASIVVDAFAAATKANGAPQAWKRLRDTLESTTRSSTERQKHLRHKLLSTTIDYLGQSLPACRADLDAIRAEASRVVEAFGEDILKLNHIQYRQGNFFEQTLKNVCKELLSRYGDGPGKMTDWPNVLRDLLGETSIPMTTIHKSKGLEYHTVIFLGLEDSAFKDLSDREGEGNNFFVAMSRAKKRILFTFSKMRSGRKQNRAKVQPLYDWLQNAGVTLESADDTDFSAPIWAHYNPVDS